VIDHFLILIVLKRSEILKMVSLGNNSTLEVINFILKIVV